LRPEPKLRPLAAKQQALPELEEPSGLERLEQQELAEKPQSLAKAGK
jgi:hypothetical protein